MTIRFLCAHLCTELQVLLVSHELGLNLVIMEGWEEGLHKRASTKPANIRNITDFFSFLFIYNWSVLWICLPHIPHISALLFVALCTFTCPHFVMNIEAQQRLYGVK